MCLSFTALDKIKLLQKLIKYQSKFSQELTDSIRDEK